MHSDMRSKAGKIIAAIFVAMVALFMIGPGESHAQVSAACTFTRDLSVGSSGEDVRCLQQYLGVAATGTFTESTRASVALWQGTNGLPSTGFFGPMSRARYQSVPGAGASASLEARTQILSAYARIQDAQDAVDDSRRNNDAEDILIDSMESFVSALAAYLSGNYTTSVAASQSSVSLANDAIDEADGTGGSSSRDDDFDDRYDEVTDMLTDARNDIRDADRDGDDVRDAEDLIDDARKALRDAKRAYDDDDEGEAFDLLDEAEDLINDALDEIEASDIDDRLDDARRELRDARDEVRDIERTGLNVYDAEELLDDAEDLLDDAEDAIDDNDDQEAEDLIDEALDLIDEALDSL